MTTDVKKSIEDQVIEITATKLGKKNEDITLTSSFVTDLGTDSLDVVELMMEFESQLNVVIPDDEAEKIKTIQDAVDYIKSKKS